jgi:hypothetical protein
MATLRKRGLRTAVVCTEPFLKLAQAQARTFGVPDLPIIMIPHPLGGISVEQVEGRAAIAWPQLEKLLREMLR